MIKKLLLASLCLVAIKCNKDIEENSRITLKQNTHQKLSNPSMESFRLAVTEMSQKQYLPTKEYTQQHGSELSDERKQILLNPAKELIFSTGISEEQLQSETRGDINLILNKAFKIYSSQTSKK